jgi:hypothetical protein
LGPAFHQIFLKLSLHGRRHQPAQSSAVMMVGAKMIHVLRIAAALALLAVAADGRTASAAPRTDCRAKAIQDLQRLSPHGYSVYQAMADKKQFLAWLTCDDIHQGLATGVHESVHLLTHQRDAFPLIEGGEVRRPHQVSRFFAPREISRQFDLKDAYVQTYLRPGAASSASDFLYLLDELNAYSHDLHAAVQLMPLQRRDRRADNRDGLASLMAFLTGYVQAAEKTKPKTWEGLMQPEPRHVVQILWAQAETVLASSCGIADWGFKDRAHIAFMSSPKNNSALTQLLGREPTFSSACMSS